MEIERNKMIMYVCFNVESGECHATSNFEEHTDMFLGTRASDGAGWTATQFTLEGNITDQEYEKMFGKDEPEVYEHYCTECNSGWKTTDALGKCPNHECPSKAETTLEVDESGQYIFGGSIWGN